MVKSSKKGGFVSDEQHIKSTTVNSPSYQLNLFPKHNVSEEHHMINQEHIMKPMLINKQHGSSKSKEKKSKKGGNLLIPHEEFEHMDYPDNNLTQHPSHRQIDNLTYHPTHHKVDHQIDNLTYHPSHKGGLSNSKRKKGGNLLIPHEEFEHMDYPDNNLTYHPIHHQIDNLTYHPTHHNSHHKVDHQIDNLTYHPSHKMNLKGGNSHIPHEEFKDMDDNFLEHINHRSHHPSHKMNLKGGNPFVSNYASISGEENSMGDVSDNWGSARHEDTIITPNSDWSRALNQSQAITDQMGGVKNLKKKTDKVIKKKSDKTDKKKTVIKKKSVKKGGSVTDFANISGTAIKSNYKWAESVNENVYPPSDMDIVYHEQVGSAKSTIKKRTLKPKSDKKKEVKPKSDKKKEVKPKSDKKKKVVKPVKKY